MDSKNKVSGSAILAAFAAVLSFCAICAAADPPFNKDTCDLKPHKYDIELGSEVSCKIAVVSKNDLTHFVRWQAADKNMNVKIIFPWPNPFLHMTDCDDPKPMCKADTAGAPADQTKVYVYRAWVCDKSTPPTCKEVTDPGIIINP